jgi:DNA uptake protein ComE-like DNA-binding protein
MQELNQSSSNAQMSFARLGTTHGYRIDGDSAALNAEIDVASDVMSSVPGLALQLWACEEPYQGGTLSGFKVAEASVSVPWAQQTFWHDSVAFAHPPATARDYAMVLVLAGERGDSRQVFDFANYPQRHRFVVPHLLGNAGYNITEHGSVALRAERVINPRELGNLTGSLVLQLWAVEAPYQDGELRGTLMASAELGQLAGQESLESCELYSALNLPTRSTQHVVLALSEWTAQGYLLRDYCNFAEAYAGPWRNEETFAATPPAAAPSEPRKLEQPAPESKAQKPAEAAKAAPVEAAKAAPVEAAKAAPVEAAKAAPVEAAKAAPVEAAKAAPVEAVKAAPMEAEKAAPVEAEKAAPVEAEKAAPVEAEKAAPVASKSEAPAANATRPSLNTVSESDLMRLAGVQKKLAGDLIKARPFKSFDDLARVRGIGDKLVPKLRTLFTL